MPRVSAQKTESRWQAAMFSLSLILLWILFVISNKWNADVRLNQLQLQVQQLEQQR